MRGHPRDRVGQMSACCMSARSSAAASRGADPLSCTEQPSRGGGSTRPTPEGASPLSSSVVPAKAWRLNSTRPGTGRQCGLRSDRHCHSNGVRVAATPFRAPRAKCRLRTVARFLHVGRRLDWMLVTGGVISGASWSSKLSATTLCGGSGAGGSGLGWARRTVAGRSARSSAAHSSAAAGVGSQLAIGPLFAPDHRPDAAYPVVLAGQPGDLEPGIGPEVLDDDRLVVPEQVAGLGMVERNRCRPGCRANPRPRAAASPRQAAGPVCARRPPKRAVCRSNLHARDWHHGGRKRRGTARRRSSRSPPRGGFSE